MNQSKVRLKKLENKFSASVGKDFQSMLAVALYLKSIEKAFEQIDEKDGLLLMVDEPHYKKLPENLLFRLKKEFSSSGRFEEKSLDEAYNYIIRKEEN